MFFSRRGGHRLIYRGDPANYDFELGDLTCDGTWYELDLSSIIPSNAIYVLLVFQLMSSDASDYIFLRKQGQTNDKNVSRIQTPGASIVFGDSAWLSVGSNGIVAYVGGTSTWSFLRITVSAWVIT